MTRKTAFIAELKNGQSVQDVFYLAEARSGQAKNGPYWMLRLTDRTGEMDGVIWSPASRQYSELAKKKYVRVSGRVGIFRESLQLVAESLEFLPEHEVDPADFMAVSQVPPEENYMHLRRLLEKELDFRPWKKFCNRVLGDDEIRKTLLPAPGAKAIHHAYAGGLLEHTLSVCRICLAVGRLYEQIDMDCLLVAAAFHDIGKAWELSSDPSREYTDEGRLVGHVVIGLQVLNPFLDKVKDLPRESVLHFKHLLLSHHGEFEFGAPRRPKTAEAWILHLADNMDAKVTTTMEALREVDAGEWSPYVRSMSRFLYHPVRPEKKTPKARTRAPSQLTIPLDLDEEDDDISY